MPTDFRDPDLAAKALCDLALSSLPPLSAGAITETFQQAEKMMPLTLTRGPRDLVEPILSRALMLTSSAIVIQMKGAPCLKCWQVDTAEGLRGASATTLLELPDGKELAMALLAWRGDDGLLYAAINPLVAKAAMSPPPPKKPGCLGALLGLFF